MVFPNFISQESQYDKSWGYPYRNGSVISLEPGMKGFAGRLRKARVAAGLTQEQLGFLLGVTKSSVSAWENERETPSFRLLPLLAKSLGLSLDKLLAAERSYGATVSTTAVFMRLSGAREGEPEEELEPEHATTEYMVRDANEQMLLMAYRALPVKQRKALLDLIQPWAKK